MRGAITAFMFNGLKRKTIVEVELDGNQCEELERLKDKAITADFKIFREKRSLNANSYAWLLIGQLAEYMNEPDVEVYRRYIKEVGLHRDVVVEEKAENTLKTAWGKYGLGWCAERLDFAEIEGFVVIRLWYGSSVYNTRQMSRFIDAIVQDCKAVGIPTMTPEEIARLTSLWEGK